jgi:hypothetical protein
MSLCKLISCSKRAIYGYIESPRQYCSGHKQDGMINLNTFRCKCGKVPSFNIHVSDTPKYCKKCKTDKMVQVRSKICVQCKKVRAGYGISNVSHCGKCKTPDMFDLSHTKCVCGKSTQIFNYPNESKPKYCNHCRHEGMVDKTNVMCPDCPVGQRGNSKYRNYCTFCFANRFPYDPLTQTIRTKSKENQVKEFININFDGFVHDQSIHIGQCDCTLRRRLDHFKMIGNTLLVIETDEHQHKRYDQNDEVIRYDDLYMIHSGKWIYIRFNPDTYMYKREKRNTHMKIRLQKLKREIEKQISRIKNDENEELVEIIYLYYDE